MFTRPTPASSVRAHMLFCLALLLPLQLAAQDAQPPSVTRYTTRAGDTLEKVAQVEYKDSPLKSSWIAQRLQEHNAVLLGQTSARQRLKTGMVMELPTPQALLQMALAPYTKDKEAEPASVRKTSESPSKAWIRYP